MVMLGGLRGGHKMSIPLAARWNKVEQDLLCVCWAARHVTHQRLIILDLPAYTPVSYDPLSLFGGGALWRASCQLT